MVGLRLEPGVRNKGEICQVTPAHARVQNQVSFTTAGVSKNQNELVIHVTPLGSPGVLASFYLLALHSSVCLTYSHTIRGEEKMSYHQSSLFHHPPLGSPLLQETSRTSHVSAPSQERVRVCIHGNKLCERTLTCFADPLQVSVELPLYLLLPPQLQELAPVLHPLSLFGKFTVGTNDGQFEHVGHRKEDEHTAEG